MDLYHYKGYVFQCINFFPPILRVRHKQAARADRINLIDITALSIFLFVFIHMLVILFAWGLLLLLKLSSLPCSHCRLVNGSIQDAVLLQVSVVRKCEHPPFSSGSGRPTA